MEEFIKKTKKVHGDKYDYSKVNYISVHKKITIICTIHGEFSQEPSNHLNGQGCRKCAGNNKKTTEGFIESAKKVHGNKYDYSKVLYTICDEKIIIICPKHGEFTQSATRHLAGSNCPKCNSRVSIISQKWLDMCGVPKDCREITIRCGRKRYIVDGYIEQTNTIYEFNGDFWHGNPEKYDPNEINPIIKKSYRELYKITIDKKKLFEKNGYKVIDIWESDFKENGETQ
jgi:hypothetical protein